MERPHKDTEDCLFYMKPFRHIHEMNMQKKLKYDRFSLISQNCLGGVIYKMLGLQDQSPTVNMFFRGESFVKLAEDPEKYLFDLEPFPISEDHEEKGLWPHPYVGVGDIRLNCLHYSSCEEAIAAWNRRRKRVDPDRILILATDWDLNYDEDLVERILNIKYPKVLFSVRDRHHPDCVYCDKSMYTANAKRIDMPVLTDYMLGYERCFEKVFDVVKWINDSFDKRESGEKPVYDQN